MKQASTKTKNNSNSTIHLSQRVREGLFITINAMSIFLLLALLTYHVSDPGWSHTATRQIVLNAAGRAGAWCADVMLSIFGYMAYLFPLILAYTSWVMFVKKMEDVSYRPIMVGTFGFFLLLLSGSALFSLFFIGLHANIPFTAGGVVGALLSHKLQALCNFSGASVLLCAALLTGITLLTGLSWANVLELIGKSTVIATNYLKQLTKWSYTRTRALKPSFNLKLPQLKRTEPEILTTPPVEIEKPASPIIKTIVAPSETPKPPIIVPPAPQINIIEEVHDDEAIEIKPVNNFTSKPITSSLDETEVKPKQPSVRTEREKLIPIFDMKAYGSLPPLTLLDMPEQRVQQNYSSETLEMMSRDVEARLQDFNVVAQVVAVHPGPVVTRFELQLAAGVKVSKITTLAKDLARSLSVSSVRVVEVIPGKPLVGLELPNENRQIVRLREILSSQPYEQSRSPLSMALGKDISGHPVIVDLGKMPHLLVAGTTGSGKSVGLNAMLLSILYKATPNDVRLILIDPKMLELSIYEGIPHLLTPVVTDMKDAANALRWCVAEMDRRYRLMAALGVRNLAGFNQKILDAEKKGTPILDPLWRPEQSPGQQPPPLQTLPFIMVLIDEFADMIMVVGKKVEELIARLAQKARAAGIHLILATQRPSVDVITGLIKANIPTRIAFQVSSRIDSRTILDQQGAEQLLGHGDMLYLPPGTAIPVRVHGAFVADHEVHNVVADWKQRGGEPEYLDEILSVNREGPGATEFGMESGEESDPLYDQAVQIVISTRRASISNIQRRLKIGYNRAASLVEMMEAAGLVSPMESNGSREVLVPHTITED